VGGELSDPLYLWDQKWIPRKRKLVYKTPKERGTLFQMVLYKKFFSEGPRALTQPTAEVSVVRHTPAVTSRTPL
jgi:hypothetical protein